MKTALPSLFDNDGSGIVNVSSLNYTTATDGLAHYSAAKAGVSQFTEVVAAEVGRYGIRVNAVAPGSTRTPLTEENGLLEGKIGEEFLDRTPLGRTGEPEDVAKVVAFLLPDYGRWITGETICVDGGPTYPRAPQLLGCTRRNGCVQRALFSSATSVSGLP